MGKECWECVAEITYLLSHGEVIDKQSICNEVEKEVFFFLVAIDETGTERAKGEEDTE